MRGPWKAGHTVAGGDGCTEACCRDSRLGRRLGADGRIDLLGGRARHNQ